MAKNTLPVDFKDDVLNEQMGGRRKYRMINNPDGTVSFEDVTTYDQTGSNFGQAQINATNQAVNESADKATVIDEQADLMANTQEGMIAGALAVKELISEQNANLVWSYIGGNNEYIKVWRAKNKVIINIFEVMPDKIVEMLEYLCTNDLTDEFVKTMPCIVRGDGTFFLGFVIINKNPVRTNLKYINNDNIERDPIDTARYYGNIEYVI